MDSSRGWSRNRTLVDWAILCLRGRYSWTEYRERHRRAPLRKQVMVIQELNRRVAPKFSPSVERPMFEISIDTVHSIMDRVSSSTPIANFERERILLKNALSVLEPSLVDLVQQLRVDQIELAQRITERLELLGDLLTELYQTREA